MEEPPIIDIKHQLHLQLTCPICENQYDSSQHAPMLVCFYQHCICRYCLDKAFEYSYYIDQMQCPFCKLTVDRQDVEKFRLMEDIVSASKNIEKYDNQLKDYIGNLMNQNKKLYKKLTEEALLNEKKEKYIKSLYVQIEKRQQQLLIQEQKTRNAVIGRAKTVGLKYLKNQYVSTQRPKANKSVYSSKSKSKSTIYGSRHIANFSFEKKQRNPTSLSYQQIKKQQIEEMLPSQKSLGPDYQQFPLNSKHLTKSIYVCSNNKKPLPGVFKNQSKISHEHLKTLSNEYQNPQNKGNPRKLYMQILTKYDFSIIKELNLSKMKINQTYFDSFITDLHLFPSIIKLDLSNNRFSLIPLGIFKLKHLKRLDFSRNNIFKISDQLIELQNLQSLDLWDNRLPLIPFVIFKMKKLKRVDLSNNKINCIQSWMRQGRIKLDLYGNPLNQKKTVITKKRVPQFLNKFISKLSKNVI